MELDSINKTLP